MDDDSGICTSASVQEIVMTRWLSYEYLDFFGLCGRRATLLIDIPEHISIMPMEQLQVVKNNRHQVNFIGIQ